MISVQNRNALRDLVLACPPRDARTAAIDLGSGGGEIVEWLIRSGFEAHGCEVDPQRAAEAQRRNPAATIACADACGWIPPARPSLVTCIELIEHLPRAEHHRFLDTIRQWLTPHGGTLVLSTPQRTSLVSIVDRLYCRWKGQPYCWWDPTHISVLKRRVLERDLVSAGFAIVDRVGVGLVPDVVTSHLGPLRRFVRDTGHRGVLGAVCFDLVYTCTVSPSVTRSAVTVPAPRV